jgi:hypothetical protein
MAYGRIDINDAVVSPFFVLASGVAAGLFELTLFGHDLADPLWSAAASSATISIANAIAVIALLVALASNKPKFSKMSGIEVWTVVATVGLVMAPPFMPVLQEMMGSHQLIGLVAVMVQAGGFYSLSYLG